MASSSLYFFLFLLYFNLPYNSADQHHQQQCPLFTCGSFGQVGFPFASTSNPNCGSFVLNCTDPVPKIQFSEELGWYPVENISYSDKRIAIHDLHLQDQLNSNHCNALKTLEPITSSVHFSLATPAFSSIVCDRSKSRDSSEEQFFQSLQNFTGCVDNYDLHFTKDYNTTVPPMPDQLLNHCIIHRLPRFQYWQNLSTWAYSVHEASVFARLESRPISYQLNPGPRSQGGRHGDPYEKQRPEHNPSPSPPPPQQPQRSSPSPPPPQQPQRSNFTKQNPSPPPLPPPPPPVTQQPQRSNFTQQNSSEPVKNLTSLSSAIYTLSWEITQDCILCQQLKGGLCQEDANGKFQCGNFKGGGKGRRREVIIALSISISSFLLIMMILCRCTRKTCLTITNWLVFGKRSKNTQLFEDFLRNHASLAPKRYSYSDIRKMTNSFKDKLGEGGFGGVFKGKLPDGSFIAVKVLKESKGNGEDFINEVASVSKTSHVNIVTLLGFCSEGSKRALVYEFMPNGSLDKFIYNKTSNTTCSHLNLEMLYEIAIGIARGLEYLHRGCTTRIVHFDIKPHNILLDENFSPKISDFGLAKLCQRKDSIMSMLGARGTIGYIAPELVYAHHRGVSYNSDVYSYGMMVLEMVGGRRNTEVGVDRTSEIYFPYWIHQRLEQEDLRLHGVESEAEREIAKKMSVVGLWCIQTNPCDRPSMSRVLDMLEGSLESLEIPPKPFLYPPERSPVDSSAN